MDYKIVKLSESYLPSLTSLLDSSFNIKNRDKLGLMTWKFFSHSHQNMSISYLALNEKQQAISQYSNIPIKVQFKNKLYNSMLCADMTTDSAYRGLGLISKLAKVVYSEVQKKGYDFSFGFSNDEGVKVDTNSSGYGYTVIGKFVRYFKIVNREKKTKFHLKKTNTFDSSHMLQTNYDFLSIYKNLAYLNWRYIQKPANDYSIYEILSYNQLYGYAVLRFLKKRCYVYDIISSNPDKENIIGILKSIENEALAQHTRLVIYNVLDNKFWKTVFNKYKYFKKKNNKANYFLTIKLHQKLEEKDILLNRDNWFLMNGDIL